MSEMLDGINEDRRDCFLSLTVLDLCQSVVCILHGGHFRMLGMVW